MGSYAYAYLNDSLLLDSSLVMKFYKGISDSALEKELLNYRAYCLKELPEIRDTVKAKNGTVSCIATDTMSHISRLKQAALYLEEAVVADPIFKITDFRTSSSEALMSFIGANPESRINRKELAKAAIELIELRPLVVGGYVKIYPVSFELEKKEIPLIYSDVSFEDCLPADILNYYKSNAVVKSIKIDQGRMLIMRDLKVCRDINISFKGAEYGFNMGFMLNSTEVEKSQDNIYKLIQERTSEPPSKELFLNWVSQSINQTARNHFIDLHKRIALCEYLGSMFVTEHSFENDLLNLNVNSQDIKSTTFNCTMQMDIPFLNSVSSEDLMSIRNNDGEAFQSFRVELEKGLKEARHQSDPDKVRAIIEDTQHELLEVRMRQIEPQVKYIKRAHIAEALIATAGVGFSISTSGVSLLATLIASLNSFKSHSDYKSKVLSNPSHFLWKVKQKAKS